MDTNVNTTLNAGVKRRAWMMTMAAAATVVQRPAFGQSGYPNKPLRLIIPFATAGAADLVGRLVADQLSRRLGQPITVENRTGAGGNIGAQAVAVAEPDGYTLLLGFDGTLTINPHLYSKTTFDTVRDFASVGKIGDVPLVIVANPQVPVRTMSELIALSKSSPGGLSYGTSGTGSTQHLMFELINQRTGAKFVHIPYKGAAQAMVDVLAGHIPLASAALASTVDMIKTGKLRALAMSSSERSKFLPDVPTLVESGYDLVITAWHAILVPAKTPRDIVDRLNAHLNAALTDPDVRARLGVLGSVAAPGTPASFDLQLRRDFERFRDVVKTANIAID
jgi:tripartite-type tricarboxylate transporter receptor subunit TctC